MMQFRGGEDVSITIHRKLDRVIVSESACCIFRVHNLLRNVNEKAYEPEVIAIGPYHRSKSHLQMMEEEKWRFLKLLLQRKKVNVSLYVEAIRPLEEKARKCYAEPVCLSSNEFIAMMVLDGCFIIELLRKFKKLKCLPNQNDTQENIRDDPLFRMEWILNSLQRDLMLFENQLPFFILSKLYEILDLPSQQNGFIDLALEFFNDLLPGHGKTRGIGVAQDIKHLLDLIHRNWSTLELEPNAAANSNMDNIKLIRCSTELSEAGIKFAKIDGDDEVLFDIQFNNELLRIPVFTIEDRTESFLRNLVAYEQYCGDTGFNIVTEHFSVASLSLLKM